MRYQKSDNRIKVIHQNNMGLSGARNTGLDAAIGEYVFFVDSDDYLQTDTFERLLLKLKSDKADITACGVKMFGDRTGSFTNNEPGIWSGHESVVQMMRTNNICTVAWNKLYKRKLFEKIRFPVGVLHEDEATTYKLLYNSGIVSYTPEQYYNYFQRAGSIMDNKMDERCKDFIDAASDRVKYFKDFGEADLAEHSMITLLDRIKYIYKKIGDKKKREDLCKYYRESVDLFTVPRVMGIKKAMALLLWKYVKY